MTHANVMTDHLSISPNPLPKNRWRKCRCGCGKKQTHLLMANGIAMGGGCELSVHRYKKMFIKKRGFK